MSLNLATEYAIRALIALAESKEKKLRVADIAQKENISLAYLNKILQRLVKSKLVSSKAGVSGGMSLSKAPNQITLKEIIIAMQGKNIWRCIHCSQEKCEQFATCKLHEYLAQAEVELLKFFRRATLADLLKT
jgi:Rrf2 family protein